MRNIHLGIIGGGQLGMLLVQSAMQFPVHVSVYDPNPNCSASFFTNKFTVGNFDDKAAIVEFGKECDILIFETEATNLEALLELESMGKRVFSRPQDLEWIQSKLTQREKLQEKGFAVPGFEELPAAEVRNYSGNFPIVQKWVKGGYDGLGVKIHKDSSSIADAAEVDSVFEEMVEIEMEISVLVARDSQGNTAVYDPVEMVFDPEANLVDYLLAPARISSEKSEELKELGQKVAEAFEFCGVYAIEIFIDKIGRTLVNEVSPRVHNSGHHTVAANVCSQYEQQIRIALGLPLGSTSTIKNSALLNLLAEAGAEGETNYIGLEEAYKISNVQYTFYGKDKVRSRRKMGHAVILEDTPEKAMERINQIKQTLTITNYGS